MSRFFVAKENITNTEIIIDNADVSHMRVLRLQVGDTVEVCNTNGMVYDAKIEEISEKFVRCSIIASRKSDTEPNIKVTLYQGLPKAAKMDYIIQKTTELGITRIVPVAMERCVVKLENRKAEEKKVARWSKIAEEAAKQSGRGIIPEICMPVPFSKAVEMLKEHDLAFAPYECEKQRKLKSVLTENDNISNVGFIIGPEGGFDLDETKQLEKSNISTVTLGKRILRTETAGEAVLAMTMYEIGDIN